MTLEEPRQSPGRSRQSPGGLKTRENDNIDTYFLFNIYCSRIVIHDDFLKNPYARLDKKKMGRV
jgi:hypothetical protein